jgi:catechol 2,3-dioxygenase-like lactoylglutathione lyase family enzyme
MNLARVARGFLGSPLVDPKVRAADFGEEGFMAKDDEIKPQKQRQSVQPAIKSPAMHPSSRMISTPISAISSLLLCLALQPALFALPADEQPERPRITGIDHVTIYVTDVKKSLHFYEHVLGLTLGCPDYFGTETCFLIRPSNQRLLLKLATGDIRTAAHQNWLAEIGFATDNVTHMRDYLLAGGFQPGLLEKDPDATQHFRILDPEGNPIAFVHRPPPKFAGSGPLSKQIGSQLIHAGFVVKDSAAENRFYVDLLGFRLYWQGGFKDDCTDWYELQLPDGPDWIEYMLNIRANADHHELGVQNHFSFGVEDAHAAAAELRARKLKKFDGPEVGRDGKDSLDAYDPDGTRVEIMEFTPKQKPCCHPYTADHPKP